MSTHILPNDIIRDHRSTATLVFIRLRPDLDTAGLQAWLQQLTTAVTTLTAVQGPGGPDATAVVGLGPDLLRRVAPDRLPVGFTTPPPPPAGAAPVGADIVVYVMTRTEALLATFLRDLSHTRTTGLIGIELERGYQRADGREQGGFRDGLRNGTSRTDRARLVYVDPDTQPDEPDWCHHGSYLAYLKVRQDLDAWDALPAEEQEQIIGRRKTDGSRLDLPPGTDPRTEPDHTSEPPLVTSHVRKSGPRGDLHDRTRIFRRGAPYLTIGADGTIDAGLQFVSFQADLEQFVTILDRWMNNPAFPTPGAGPDRLFTHGHAQPVRHGLFFVPRDDDRHIAAGLFDHPTGRLVVRKKIIDTNGRPVLAELGGIGFQIINPATGTPVGDEFFTDSTGRAHSPDLPRDTLLLLRETRPPVNAAPVPDQTVTLTRRRNSITVTNTVQGPGPGYGG